MKGRLINKGNTCYLNSAIQALRFLLPVVSFLTGDKNRIILLLQKNIIKICKNSILLNNPSNHPVIIEIKRKIVNNDYDMLTDDEKSLIISYTITYQLLLLFERINNENIVDPGNFINIFLLTKNNFGSNNQQDAEEVYSCIIQQIHEEICEKRNVHIAKPNFDNLSYLLDKLHIKIYHNIGILAEEIKLYETIKHKLDNKDFINGSYDFMNKYYTENYSKITTLFSGFFVSNLICPNIHCNFISRKIDLFLHLQLPIPRKPNITLNDCFLEYFKTETLDNNNLWFCDKCKNKVPAIKKISLWSLPKILVIQLKRFSTLHVKNNDTIEYPLENLDISEWIDTLNRESISYPAYKLYAIINHIGNQSGGHYFSYCRDDLENKWFEYDDEKVKELSSNMLISPNAYMLFYARKKRTLNNS